MLPERAMLVPRVLRRLNLDAGLHPRGQTHLSAASGLVRVGRMLYVVADDEHHLGMFEEAAPPATPLALLRLFDGDLPHGKKRRKAAKPDLETLAYLPPLSGFPHGALLAMGSGSRPNRETGVMLALDAHGDPTGHIAALKLEPLYAPLRDRFPDLNIEGAFVTRGELHLLQRGNQRGGINACIRFDWNLLAPWLEGQRTKGPVAKAVSSIVVGDIDGVSLGLTDGAALSAGAWVFCAVAENTSDSYQDGACAGAVVGVVRPDGSVQQRHALQGAPKVEGIAVRSAGATLVLTLVTDPDDPAIASELLELVLPGI